MVQDPWRRKVDDLKGLYWSYIKIGRMENKMETSLGFMV